MNLLISKLRAGDTWKWERTDLSSIYPSDVWSLKYYFKNASNYFNISADPQANKTFSVTVTATATTAYIPSIYSYVAYAEKGTGVTLERYEVDRGTLEVLPPFASTVAYDNRTDARKIYDDLITAYKKYVATSGMTKSYQIGEMQMEFRDEREILQKVSYWKSQVQAEEQAERIAQGLGTGRKIITRFR